MDPAKKAELKTLKISRQRIFERVQKSLNIAREIPTRPEALEQFLARASRQTKALTEFESVVKQCYKIEVEHDPELSEETYLESIELFEDMYFELMGCFDKYNSKTPTAPTAHDTSNVALTMNTTAQQLSVRLPRLDLKTFDGTLTEWAEFKHNYEALIHNNDSLSASSKYYYLRSSLRGPALAIVKELPLLDQNYLIAWTELSKRYDNSRMLGAELLRKIINFHPISHEDESQLQKFLSIFRECFSALQKLEIEKLDDFIVLHLALQALPLEMRKAFERKVNSDVLPTFTDLMDFVQKQILILDLVSRKKTPSQSDKHSRNSGQHKQKFYGKQALMSSNQSSSKPNQKPNSTTTFKPTSSPRSKLCACDGGHKLYHCPAFQKMSIEARRAFVKNENLCFNCFRRNHFSSQCENEGRCRHCNQAHHSLLHLGKPMSTFTAQVEKPTESSAKPSAPALSAIKNTSFAVLLGSAVFKVKGADGKFFKVRGIIDSGASNSFISSECANRIGLSYEKSNHPVAGIGNQSLPHIEGSTKCIIKPCHSDEPVLSTETLVIPLITADLPHCQLPAFVKKHFRKLVLADSDFDTPAPVEFLIGADIFPFIYTGKSRPGSEFVPPCLSSIFGWVVTGRLNTSYSMEKRNVFLSTDKVLQKFWEIEEVPSVNQTNPEDEICEEIFKTRHYRLPDGRYVTPIMLKEDPSQLGDSKAVALKRLMGLKTRLDSNPTLKSDYTEFLTEYEDLGHMSAVSPSSHEDNVYFIPHHCVVKEESVSTKVRVVYDASQKTTSSKSLNDILYAGPKLQHNVFDIIFNFRLHNIVFTCDIYKMFRQILVRPDERKYQHILWFKNGQIQEYELNTVTQGVTSAPYISQRTVHQLAEDEGEPYPLGAKALRERIFVDDIVTGQNDVSTAIEEQRQLIALFDKGKFKVKKWSSNHPALLADIPEEDRITSIDLNDENHTLKVLGVFWDAKTDQFYYHCKLESHTCSKRIILSNISKIFDPLGWLSPIVFFAKVLMQKLWLEGISWDERVPTHLEKQWQTFCESLPSIASLRINRHAILPQACTYELIGFCDASQAGMCAVIYLRSSDEESIKVSLLTAKSKVAPTKTVSIPRLELCGAQLLASLIQHSYGLLINQFHISTVFTFTDSEIVLAWLKTLPCRLKTFVANRVSYILDKISPESWGHVATHDNPADIGSRGCLPHQLESHNLWWSGPDWLQLPIDQWPKTGKPKSDEEQTEIENEMKPASNLCLVTCNKTPEPSWLFDRYSSLSSLLRITARMLRFCQNGKSKPQSRNLNERLSSADLDKAEKKLVKLIQDHHFHQEIKLTTDPNMLPRWLRKLKPFLDQEGILRVGGRLSNASLPEEQKHPMLLPKISRFVNLLIDYYHKVYLHIGPRTLQAILARRYWIISARQVIRSRLSKCVPCFKAQPKPLQPLMGDLPRSRVSQGRPFLNVGTDFAGPIYTKDTSLRKARHVKSYIVLFVCLSTKAVHLDLVSSLSTPAFIAAFDRFIGRRGLCQTIYSDCGSNFIGAKRKLGEIEAILSNPKVKNELSSYATTRGVEWNFNPPSAPNFGGLWEAAVKSTKYHIKRVIGDQCLTFEEMCTVLVKIEAMLNSRPLCPLSDDPAECNVLTPGHFLTGAPLVARPELQPSENILSYSSRWQLLSNMTQHFWRAWQREYLHTLLQRSKWTKKTQPLKIGDLVMISDAALPPCHWPLGKVTELYPGKDNVVRVVQVKTQNGSLRRPVSKLCPLPLD